MRRYSRYKICKTNFHFFFFSSRILNFNRPKWNLLKEKIEGFKKINKQTLQNKYKTKYFKFILPFFFDFSSLFNRIKIKQKKQYLKSSNIQKQPNKFFYSYKPSYCVRYAHEYSSNSSYN